MADLNSLFFTVHPEVMSIARARVELGFELIVRMKFSFACTAICEGMLTLWRHQGGEKNPQVPQKVVGISGKLILQKATLPAVVQCGDEILCAKIVSHVPLPLRELYSRPNLPNPLPFNYHYSLETKGTVLCDTGRHGAQQAGAASPRIDLVLYFVSKAAPELHQPSFAFQTASPRSNSLSTCSP